MNNLNYWNKLNLPAPPVKTWFISKHKFDINKFTSILNKILKDFESMKMLHLEAAILSRLIYRMKSKFRSDKGLKMMEKVNRTLLNYLSINFYKVYTNFKECVEMDDNMISLPSKQMLEFLLIRIQSLAKLMCRVEEVAKHAGHMLKSRISMGHAWIVSSIAYAVISRIWVLSRHVVKKSCNWYYHMYEYLDTFKTVGSSWLPKNYDLPSNLKLWLNVPWIDQSMPNIPTQENLLQSVLNTINVDDECDNDVTSNIDKTQKSDELHKNIVDELCSKNMETLTDVGEPVDRNKFESVIRTSDEIVSKKKKKNKKRKFEESERHSKKTSKNKKKKRCRIMDKS